MIPSLVARVVLIEASKAIRPESAKGGGFAMAHDAPARVPVVTAPAAPKAKGKKKKGKPLKGQTGGACTGLLTFSGARVQFAEGETVREHVSLARLTLADDAAARWRIAKGEAREALALAIGGTTEGSAERADRALTALCLAWNTHQDAVAKGVAPDGAALDLVWGVATIASPAEVSEAFGKLASAKAAIPFVAPVSAMLRETRKAATATLGASKAGAALAALRAKHAKLGAPRKGKPVSSQEGRAFSCLWYAWHASC